MAIKVQIIEDDLIIAENLKENLEALDYIVTGVATNAEEAIDLYHSNPPDICIVDIYLKGSAKNGIEIMQTLDAGTKMPIIYLTSFSDQEIRMKAKSTNPSAFLVKPASQAQVDVAIDFALTNFKKQSNPVENNYLTYQSSFFVKVKDRYEKINFPDIAYVMASGSYTKIYTSQKEYTISTGLKSFLEQVDSKDILRCHRSYAVNVQKIKAFDDINLFITREQELRSIPISQQYKSHIQAYLTKIKAD